MFGFMKRSAKKVHHIREVFDKNFKEIRSLEDAKNDSGGYVVFHGDEGGQVYLTIPARQVNCTEADLSVLLAKIDHECWDNPRTSLVYFEHGEPGQSIPGGMGGGVLTDGLWLHDKITPMRSMVISRLGLSGSSRV